MECVKSKWVFSSYVLNRLSSLMAKNIPRYRQQQRGVGRKEEIAYAEDTPVAPHNSHVQFELHSRRSHRNANLYMSFLNAGFGRCHVQ